MAWDDSGGGNKDPWGNRGNDGPPDLDEAIKKLQGQLSGIFGGRKGSSSGGGSPSFTRAVWLGLIALPFIYFFSGIYQVDEQERGVVFTFGQVSAEETTSGLKFFWPIVQTVELVNVTQVQSHSHSAAMLTKDENIVDVSLTVQWVVGDATDFLINVKDPKVSLAHATESALRHVVGSSSMDSVITEGRESIAVEVQERLRTYLENYGTGIDVLKVNIDQSAPPVQVQEAFNDVQKAKEDRQKFINQATAYAQQVVPEARGRAQRQIEEAQAYRDRVIARSDGEAQRFEKLLGQYALAERVTRDRLYIDALEGVFKNSSKVVIDVEGGNNMMYLPLDKLGQTQAAPNFDRDALRSAVEELRREFNSNRTQPNRIRGAN